MPSIQYMNRSAPFWDWVASFEQEGTNHPFFSQWNNNQGENNERGEEGHHGPHGHHGPPPAGPWGWGGFGGRGFPFRGPPPPGPPPHHEEHDGEKEKEKDKDGDNDNGEGPSGSGSDTEGRPCGRGRHGRCGSRRGRHGWGGYGGRGGFGPHHGPPHHGPHGHGHGHGHGRRGWGGPWGRGGPFGGGPFNPLNFAAGLFDPESNDKKEDEDFAPDADIFDTPSSFVIHVSLPGAKKEDVGVNWDAEKSELSIAGVIYRPGDEEFLKTLAMDERKVGPFERKVRLGTRANPALVDADGISAKLEDGVLRVDVPKLGDNGFVEVRKVDVE